MVPKLLGSDMELGNFVLGLEREGGTGAMASRALLREIEGLPLPDPGWAGYWQNQSRWDQPIGTNPQDWGRKYLPSNGGSFYIDLDHLECCTAEVVSAYDFTAEFHAMLRIARSAVQAANARLPDGIKIVALVNNEDGQGHSYGSHLSLQTTRAAWDRLFHRKLQDLLLLASFQVSSIILTGQGKVSPQSWAANGDRGCYELSQRAPFFRCLVGAQTTSDRPIVNSRDEALCGQFTAFGSPADRLARLHSIFFDSTLCPVSIFLRAGLMQIILSILERGDTEASLNLLLADPVETVARWSRDPMLNTRATVLTGEEVTAIDLQKRFFDLAAPFVESGGCDGIVPASRVILELWADTLDKLNRREFVALSGRLDWVLKLQLLERAMEQGNGLNWASPEIKHLDFKYADLEQGLFWACDQAGAVDRFGVTDEQIQKFTRQPPPDTRAWTRSHLLRLAAPESVADVDWDKITFKLRLQSGAPIRRTITLADPLGFTQQATQAVFDQAEDLEQALDLLGAPQRDPELVSTTAQYTQYSLSPHYPINPTTPRTNWSRDSERPSH
jgi:hypothetical protein